MDLFWIATSPLVSRNDDGQQAIRRGERRSRCLFLILFTLLGCLTKEAYAYSEDSIKTAVEKPPKVSKQVTLKILDKETGQVTTFTTPLSKPVRYKSLIIRPRSCIKKKAGMAYEVRWSFIEAWIQPPLNNLTASGIENKPETIPVHLIFSSWLNSALPGFFHPNYAILIQDCKDIATP